MSKVIIKRKDFERILAERNYSLRSLARALGNEQKASYLSACVRGKHAVGSNLRKKIIKELECSFDELFRIV